MRLGELEMLCDATRKITITVNGHVLEFADNRNSVPWALCTCGVMHIDIVGGGFLVEIACKEISEAIEHGDDVYIDDDYECIITGSELRKMWRVSVAEGNTYCTDSFEQYRDACQYTQGGTLTKVSYKERGLK